MDERRASSSLLLGLLLAQLIGLSAQVSTEGNREESKLRAVVTRLTAPLLRSVLGARDLVQMTALSVADRRLLRDENRLLEEEVERLRREQARLGDLEIELEMLRETLKLKPPDRRRVQVADVIWADHRSWQKRLTLRLESAGGPLLRNSPVVTQDGLVGRIVQPAGPYAQVQLVTDRASSVGAMIERTRRQGIVRGAEDGALSLDYVQQEADLRPGDRLVTSGIDGIYPRGIAIGTVVDVAPGDDLFLRVRVAPAVNLGRVSKLFVLDPVGLPEGLKDDARVVR